MYDLSIIALVGIAAFVMLLKRPKWTLPALIGAVTLFPAPTVTMLATTFFTTQGGQPPLLFETKQGEFSPYLFPDLNLQKVLERNYKAIHETFEALLTVQQAPPLTPSSPWRL